MTIKHAEELTEEVILNMNYPDFVALMQQDNTPPGAEYTIDYWIKHGCININSKIQAIELRNEHNVQTSI